MGRHPFKTTAVGLALLTVVCALFWQVRTHQFINLDDIQYVTGNPRVRAGLNWSGIVWSFTATAAANWHPLTWLSHMADCQFFGLDPAGHHLMSLALHTFNTLLLLSLLLRLTRHLWCSAFVSALFALHPLHVESVAWIAERKDLLSTLFFLLTLHAYGIYAQRPGPLRYFSTLFLFALGLMAKPMLVTLPLILLLLDLWPLCRLADDTPGNQHRQPLQRLILEKVPFLVLSVLSVLSSMVTFMVQHGYGAVVSIDRIPLLLRIENGFVSYVRYLAKTFWPSDLAIYYPFDFHLSAWQPLAALLLLGGVTLVALRQRRAHPYLTVGWLWYLVTLLPVIGFVQAGSQAFADRYTYIPLIGIFISMSWGLSYLVEKSRLRPALVASIAAVLLMVLALLTYRQIGYWRSSITLYNHALAVTSPNRFVLDNLAGAYLERGEMDKAAEQCARALQVDREDHLAHFILGLVYDRQGKLRDSIFHYTESLRLKPGNAVALTNLGRELALAGEYQQAQEAFESALRINPGDSNARYNLEWVITKLGR